MAKFFGESKKVENREEKDESNVFFTVPKTIQDNLKKTPPVQEKVEVKKEEPIKEQPVPDVEPLIVEEPPKPEPQPPETITPQPEPQINQVEKTSNIEVLEPQNQTILDPLNNKNNPIPVNPIASKEDTFSYENVEVNIKDILMLLKEALLNPGEAFKKGDKYQSFRNAIKVTLYTTGITLILSIIISLLTGIFTRNYNSFTGTYTVSFNPIGMFNQNWLQIIFKAIVCSGFAIYIVAGIYYAISFIRNKSIPFGKYLLIATPALTPFIVSITCLYPIAILGSEFLGILIVGIGLVYSLVSLVTGINQCLQFPDDTKMIFYNVINLSIIFLLILTIYYLYSLGNTLVIGFR